MVGNWEKYEESEFTPVENKERKEVKVDFERKENIIFVGSELYYESFWAKMMFISAATYQMQHCRSAEFNILAYIPYGYTRLELGIIELYCKKFNFIPVAINSTSDMISLFNSNRNIVKIQDVYFFCHGEVSNIKLNYSGSPSISISMSTLSHLKSDIFVKSGNIYSYACRTGISVHYSRHGFFSENFKTDDEAGPFESLAMKMANHFNVNVHAFYRRTSYKHVTRDVKDSQAITEDFNSKCAKYDGCVHTLIEKYEALPHPGLDAADEKDYALWRIAGGRRMPMVGNSPAGLSSSMFTFSPGWIISRRK